MRTTLKQHKRPLVSEADVHRWLKGADVGALAPQCKWRRARFPNLQPTDWDRLYTAFQKSKPISIRLPVRVIDKLKQVALQKGIGYQALLRLWVTEKLQAAV